MWFESQFDYGVWYSGADDDDLYNIRYFLTF